MTLLQTDLELTRNSYYAATAPRRQRFPVLQSHVDADVAIVGGGLAGLSAAIELADRGYSVALLEARQVGWGASGRNGGQAIAGLACEQSVIESQLGREASRRVWDMTLESIRLIGERRQRFGIDCDWRDGYLGLAVNERKARELRTWQEQMHADYGYESTWIPPQDMQRWIASSRFHGGIHDPLGGHLHPLKYSMGMAAAAASLGVQVFEESGVTEIVPGRVAKVRTAQGSVNASHVLLAGNVYLQGVAPVLESRVMPVGTYIVTSEAIEPALAASLIPSGAAACDTNFVLDYFRPTLDHRMLYGGRVSYSTTTPSNLAESMQRRMARTFPQLRDTKVEFAWGGFVDISMNRAPDFGRLADRLHDKGGPDWSNVYYLQGFSGHGLALTGLAGKLVAEAIAGDAERFDTFARIRHRSFPGGKLLRTPALVAGMAYYRLKDLL
ncbi:FAD-binding oxidoreductase [Rhizobacter sp. AJA081-3]|uniref:NAD(P)/FAD-dependent oxidoreductase n=1 Tax=Rhizobacter sp. AJA081-3 TaxID=2753607 RepID=UPI001AE063C8|nr:FAD-binding oxidoreductase [Rhizobacter sp. AJA081-3]QTN25221.1 FAD-binding oxidoreductase [Rhizobacter sp. AJA081-3]